MIEEFLGRGLEHPMRLAAAGLAESAGVAKVERSIRIILGTGYGERLMRPDFGCNLKSLVFAPRTTATANLARFYVTEGLAQWEPRIEVLDVAIQDGDLGAMLIDITYRLRATQDVHSLVYPFLLERS